MTAAEIRPDVEQVTAPQGPPYLPAKPLYEVSESEAQCLAAEHSTLANLLDREADLFLAPVPGQSESAGQIARTVLILEATHQRNQASGAAVEGILRLAEARAGLNNIDARVKEIESIERYVQNVRSNGLIPAVSEGDVQGQRLELLHRRVEVEGTVEQLHYQLCEAMGVDDGGARIWPNVSLDIRPATMDREQAVAEALRNRADLAALRFVLSQGESDAAAAARLLLRQFSPGLGAASSPCCIALLLHRVPVDCDAPHRVAQLCELLRDRERAVTQETMLAVTMLEVRLAQVSMTKERLRVAEVHLRSVQEQRELLPEAALNSRKAKLALLEVEQQLLHDVIEYRVAETELRQAKGLLAIECGYDAATCYQNVQPCCPY